MKRTINFILSLLHLTLMLSLASCGGEDAAPAGSTAIQTIDFSGMWGVNLLFSGSGENNWERGTLTVSGDNSTFYSGVNSAGIATALSGTISISDGIIIMTDRTGIQLYADPEHTVMHGAASGGEGAGGIYTAVRQGELYSAEDLAGNWQASILVSGPSAPWWERGTLSVDSQGTFTGSTVDIFGEPGYLARGGSCAISPDGLVSMASFTLLQGVMDAGKTVMIWTDTWPDGSAELGILTRQAASYSSADLEGTWKFSSLSTGAVSSATRGTMTVSSGGSAVIEYENLDGTVATSTTVLISPSGAVTVDGFPLAQGAMDSGKTVMVFTETSTILDSVMTLLTKQ